MNMLNKNFEDQIKLLWMQIRRYFASLHLLRYVKKTFMTIFFLPFLLTIEGEVADAAAIVIVDHVTICDNMGDAANGSGYI